jgi:hypothetical protein
VTPKSAIEVAFPSTGKLSRAVYCCRRQAKSTAKSIDGTARLQQGSQETEEIPAEHLDNILLPQSALEQASVMFGKSSSFSKFGIKRFL